ncbi:carbohydrate ABC transporter permease [Kineococcus sp. DHX-1]|uniref:carbohydrate ABC transporter permease n=1 Tax=Kineococcus sp. DHX-1 TaxID=3349638 RepID=UPI0036D34C4C
MATLSPAGASGLQVRPAAPRPVRRRGLPRPGTVGKFAVLTVAVFLTLGPVVWTVWTSFRPQVAGAGVQPGFSAYVDVFAKADVLLLVWNSVLVTSLCALGQMVTAAMAGYVFARVQFRGSGALFAVVLATMMVPLQVTIVPVFMLIRGMGLSDTLLALVLPAIPTAFGTFLMRQYFLGLPDDLAEAAAIDGAGPLRTFSSVYAPLALPGMAIVGILAFNYHWNEFFRPLILTVSERNFTMPLGLVSLQGNLGTGSVSTVLAGVVLSMVPALVVFVLGQRPLREGLTAGVGK